eukprot:scaffold3765_cov122-Isochrysis_galbana.AAC.10
MSSRACSFPCTIRGSSAAASNAAGPPARAARATGAAASSRARMRGISHRPSELLNGTAAWPYAAR